MLARKCDNCKQTMANGYNIKNETAYYCSDRCLRKHYNNQEWNDLHTNGESRSYWTLWQVKYISFEEAAGHFHDDQEVYLIYQDGTESLAEHMDDITWHEGTCGKFVLNEIEEENHE